MRSTGRIATVVAAALALTACQSTTQTRSETMTGIVSGAYQMQASPTTDVSRLWGKWEGRGDTDGARRRLEVDTDAQGEPMVPVLLPLALPHEQGTHPHPRGYHTHDREAPVERESTVQVWSR